MIELDKLFIHGRYYYDGNLYLYNTASGIEFSFLGKKVIITLKADSRQLDRAWMRLIIDNDDKNAVDIKFGPQNQEITLYESIDNEIHNLKLLKVSEAIESHVIVSDLVLDGVFLDKPIYKDTFLVLGDSTVSAYGNLGEINDLKTLDDTDGLRGFAYLTCKEFNASMNSLNGSGWGVAFSPWTTPKRSSLLSFYDKVAPLDNHLFDVKSINPRYIIISLGTNDYHYIFNDFDDIKNEKEKLDEFRQTYHQLLVKLADDYPKAKIIMVYGVMLTTPNLEIMHQIYLDNKDDFNLYELASLGDGLGIGTHPSAASHSHVACDLIKLIKEIENEKY